MAGTAIVRRVTKNLRLVAGSTFRIAVFAQQGEPRQAMVEEQAFTPGLLIVTVGALCAQGSVMRVVILVAPTTACERFFFE